MSQLPPCSGRPGIVRAPSLPTLALTSSEAVPACTFCGSGGCATMRFKSVVLMRSASRLFHFARRSAEGAQPRIPGWISPGKRTPGMCREEQKIPSKSQIALALGTIQSRSQSQSGYVRLWIQLVEKPTPITGIKNACEAPRLFLHWLNVLNLYNKHIPWLGSLNLERPCKVVDLGKVDILYVVCAVVVLDLTTCPVNTLNLNNLVVLDLSCEGYVRMPSVLERCT